MKNKKGYVGLIAILVVVTIAALWMVYEFRKNWLGAANVNLSKDLPVGNNSSDAQPATVQPKSINGQLDDLRQNLQSVQDASDKQVIDELNK